MHDLVEKIEEGLGSDRLRELKRKEDEYQMFWVGVLEALPKARPQNEVPYLITAGYGAVRNYRRAENSRAYYKVCPQCGESYGYRTRYCSQDGALLENRSRSVEYLDRHETSIHEQVEERILLEQFVGILEGRRRYIARRWLLDRADVLYDNHIKQIAGELGISAPAVARHKQYIKEQLFYWYEEE